MEKNKKMLWGAITGVGAALLIPGGVMVGLNINSYNQKAYVLTLSDTFSGQPQLLKTYSDKLIVGQNVFFKEGGFIDTVFVKTTKDTVVSAYNDYISNVEHQVELRTNEKLLQTKWNTWTYNYRDVKRAIEELDYLPITDGIDKKFWGFCAMTIIGGLLFLAGGTVLGTKGAKKMANKLGIKQKLPKEESESKTEAK